MKKSVALLVLLLAAMLAAGGVLPVGMPEELSATTAQTSDGRVYAAENRDAVSRIYTLRNNEIFEVYEEFRVQGGAESRIARVAAEKQDVYFLRAFTDGKRWELLKLADGMAAPAAQGSFETGGTVTGLAVRNRTTYITVVHTDGTVAVYAYGNTDRSGLVLLLPVAQTEDVVSAEYDGTRLRAATKQGDFCFIDENGRRSYSDEAVDAPAVKVTAASIRGVLLCKRLFLAAAAILWLVIAVSVLLTVAVTGRAARLATRLTCAGSEVIFLTLLAVLVLVSRQILSALGPLQMLRDLVVMSAVAGVILLVGILLLRGVSGRMTRALKTMTEQMDDVAEGRVDIREVKPGKDELHRMDRSMQEMCMSLSIRNYELETTIRSYQRFVPEQLTELLNRAAVAEVSLGDSRRLTGDIGLFSVGNRAEARDVLQDDAFVDFINHSFGIFQECVRDNNGSMISSGLRLSAMETMFPRDAADGVKAGLDFLGRTQKKAGEGIPVPHPFLILHRASFLYGVAGQETRLFPYLSSGEMEFLGSFAQRFHGVGVRIIMTEAYWKQLEGRGFDARYIGFVSDEEWGTYKLYELLDAYPELEKKVRLGYEERFQEAVNLFYRNDFFLARNLFSTLLRACPEDGIVRWYLFACEHYFNQEGTDEVDYQLFGIHE